MIYIIGFCISLGPIVWSYNAEILPEKGVSIATFVNWFGVLIVTYTFPLVDA